MLQPTGERVFFIYADDDHDDHETLADAIKRSSIHYELKSVYDGEELINVLRESVAQLKPTFLVVDVNMPRMDGFTAVKHIKTRLKLSHLPIYALSTSGNNEDRQKAKELGMAGYYTKPARISDLRDIIDEMAIKAFKFQER